MAGPCKHCGELSDSIKGGELVERAVSFTRSVLYGVSLLVTTLSVR
jgi:hypothetical protein